MTKIDDLNYALAISNVVRQLLAVLGSRLASFVCNIDDPKALGQIAEGAEHPNFMIESRLRWAHAIVLILETVFLPDGIQAWLTARNSSLDDQSPMDLLRTDNQDDCWKVLNAARILSLS